MDKVWKLDHMSPEAKIAGLGTELEALVILVNELRTKHNNDVDLVNHLKTALNTHITGGVHRAASSVNASAALVTDDTSEVTTHAAVPDMHS